MPAGTGFVFQDCFTNIEVNFTEVFFPKPLQLMEKLRHQSIRREELRLVKILDLEFSENSHFVEKLPTNESDENFGAYNGLLVNFSALNYLPLFEALRIKQILDTMNGHYLKKRKTSC